MKLLGNILAVVLVSCAIVVAVAGSITLVRTLIW